MAAPSVVTFKIRFPEYTAVGDEVIQFWLDDSAAELSEESWGECYPTAVEMLAAHKLALSMQRQVQIAAGTNPTVGAVQSASADGLSVSLALSKAAAGSARDSWLAQTPYGLEYLAHRESCLGRGHMISCP